MSVNLPESTSWSSEQLFERAEDYYAALLDNINTAHTSVDLESYIFDYDDVGGWFIVALIAAAQRGVRVRVLIDGVGSHASAEQVVSALLAGGVAARVWAPLPWNFNQYRWSKQRRAIATASYWQRFFVLWRRINKRNHRKLIVIDNDTAWTGSINITQQHLGGINGEKAWRDIGVRVTGNGVLQLAQTFNAIWANRPIKWRFEQFRQLLSNHTRRLRWERHRMLLALFRDAQQRIWIESAYFAPPGQLLRALHHAAGRGVDVRIVVPAHSDIFFFPALTSTWYADLLTRGARIFEYQRSVLHSKALIVDEHYLVGSSNFNHRSLLHDLEIDVFLGTAAAQQQLVNIIHNDMQHSHEITLRRMQRYPNIVRLLGWIPRLLRYWL